MRKTTILLLPLLCNFNFTQAQFYKSILPPDAFSDSLSIIVQDFIKNFATIEGMQLASEGEKDVYNSTATIPGALHCSIFRFHSLEDTTATWQAILYEGEVYDDAVKIYKKNFRLLKKSRIKGVTQGIGSFNGELQIPQENVRFTTTQLKLNTDDVSFNRFFAEIEMIGSYNGWEVHLNLYNKKNDTEKY
ncbi:MAG: hypothetical protein ABIN01_07350 [Ferruginibacter sp.]